MSDSPSPSHLLRVEGMSCQNCARHVREAAESVPAVLSAVVNLEAGRLRVRWKEGAAPDPGAVSAAVALAGYQAHPIEDSGNSGDPGTGGGSGPGGGWRINMLLGGSVTLFLMIAEWGLGWMRYAWYPWLAMVAALPVQVIGGSRFYRGAWTQLRQGAANMDTLVALGSTTAFLFSAWVLLSGAGGHVYFMEAAAIITLISVGHYAEARATHRATTAMRALMELAPATARRVDERGQETEVPAADLVPGDRIVVRPGDRVPTDAEVLEGTSAVDEAMLTGESAPVEKGPGATLLAGTANSDGRLLATVTATGEGTVLAHIIAAVERAQNSRADIQRLADKVSSVFVPVVVLLAIGAALAWGLAPVAMRGVHGWLGHWLWPMQVPASPGAAAVVCATAVLIIACPCAMGLATPAAIMAGANAAAIRGILVRDGVALEKAGHIDTIVFDKTGTLTEGRLTAGDVRRVAGEAAPADEPASVPALAPAMSLSAGRNPVLTPTHSQRSPGEVGRAVAGVDAGSPRRPADPWAFQSEPGSLEQLIADLASGSSHPVARSLVPPGWNRNPESSWTDWRELRGRGIEARRGATVYRLGSLAWLRETGVDIGAEQTAPDSTGEAIVSRVGVAADNRLLAVAEVRDKVRREAAEVVSALKRDGFDVFLVTGDAPAAARAVARSLGIPDSNVRAGVRPEEKVSCLAKLQREGRRVAFVGDGINDGPALAQADLGIAVGQATDVARESADLVLMRQGLGAVREAVGLAQATLRTIRQNLFWAFFYNALAVPLAMLGFFNPVLSAAAMGVSDLVVIGNALRLRYWTPAGARLRVR